MLISSWRDNSSYRFNTLGSFCIQQCFYSWVQQIQSKTVILAFCPQRFPLLHHHPFGIPTIVCIPTYSRPLLAFPKHEHSEKWGFVRCASVEWASRKVRFRIVIHCKCDVNDIADNGVCWGMKGCWELISSFMRNLLMLYDGESWWLWQWWEWWWRYWWWWWCWQLIRWTLRWWCWWWWWCWQSCCCWPPDQPLGEQLAELLLG